MLTKLGWRQRKHWLQRPSSIHPGAPTGTQEHTLLASTIHFARDRPRGHDEMMQSTRLEGLAVREVDDARRLAAGRGATFQETEVEVVRQGQVQAGVPACAHVPAHAVQSLQGMLCCPPRGHCEIGTRSLLP